MNEENVSARDLLLLCSTPVEQQIWIDKIRKYIPKKNPNGNNTIANSNNNTNNVTNSTTLLSQSSAVNSQSNHSISSQNSNKIH